jgi:hypothetical protein
MRPSYPRLVLQLACIPEREGTTANILLSEFFRGRPLGELREALRHENPRVVQHAMWITAELGVRGAELLTSVTPLLEYPVPKVRFFALESVLVCATEAHGDVLAQALSLVDDESETVRYMAFDLWARATIQQLAAGLNYIHSRPESVPTAVATSLSWMLSPGASEVSLLDALVRGEDALSQRLGAIASARLGNGGNRILSQVRHWRDDALENFVRDWLSSV